MIFFFFRVLLIGFIELLVVFFIFWFIFFLLVFFFEFFSLVLGDEFFSLVLGDKFFSLVLGDLILFRFLVRLIFLLSLFSFVLSFFEIFDDEFVEVFFSIFLGVDKILLVLVLFFEGVRRVLVSFVFFLGLIGGKIFGLDDFIIFGIIIFLCICIRLGGILDCCVDKVRFGIVILVWEDWFCLIFFVIIGLFDNVFFKDFL